MRLKKVMAVVAVMVSLRMVSARAEEPVGVPARPPIASPSGAGGEREILEGLQASEREAAVSAAKELYKKGEYPLAAERVDAALGANPKNAEALLLGGLTRLRLNDLEKASALWERFQQETPDARLGEDIGKMRTILLREVAERAAKDAVAREQRLVRELTSPRTVAVATFRNAGTQPYGALGKALAAMLIDNLSAVPGIRVLERERVEALEEEANLSGSGLVEKGTAVRAGKLLRAGRVTAGSHADWTASPTHLRLDALLVDVDTGNTVAEGKSQAMATEFYKLVPDVATKFALALNQAPLAPLAKQKISEEHTHNLGAALSFGKVLDALDHHDTKAALESCKEMEKLDPNFQLAKRKCAFIPLTWLSTAGIASAVEPAALGTAVAGGSSYTIPLIAGLVVAGGIAGGTYAAVHGGGGGGGGAGAGGNNAPQLNGVGDRTVGAGQTAAIDMDCRDPDGSVTTIASGNLPPGGSFSQTQDNPTTGRYRQTTTANQVGQSFTVSFTCTDGGNPGLSTSRSATIRIVAQPQPQPTPTLPAAAPTPTPQVCLLTGVSCNPQNPAQCCTNNCDSKLQNCCVPRDGGCSSAQDCCTEPSGTLDCAGGVCCRGSGANCFPDGGCCAGLACVTFSAGVAFCEFPGG